MQNPEWMLANHTIENSEIKNKEERKAKLMFQEELSMSKEY